MLILYVNLNDLFKSSGNKVSRNSVMCGSQNIILQGRVSIVNVIKYVDCWLDVCYHICITYNTTNNVN